MEYNEYREAEMRATLEVAKARYADITRKLERLEKARTKFDIASAIDDYNTYALKVVYLELRTKAELLQDKADYLEEMAEEAQRFKNLIDLYQYELDGITPKKTHDVPTKGLQTSLTECNEGDEFINFYGDRLLVTICTGSFIELKELTKKGTPHKRKRPLQFVWSNLTEWWERVEYN